MDGRVHLGQQGALKLLFWDARSPLLFQFVAKMQQLAHDSS